MANTVTAESWSHLCDVLFEDSWQADIGRFRSQFVYKGLSDARYDLTTTLMRLGGNYADVERHLLRNFMKYAQRDVSLGTSLWNWLALAQHHGLPTRLLDWTYSPFVALHFATSNLTNPEGESVVWAVDHIRAHRLLPKPLQKVLSDEGSDVWTTELLDGQLGTWESLNALKTKNQRSKAAAGKDDAVLLFFEPPSLDQRIVNQYALFSVLSSPSVSLEAWLADHEDLARRIVIPRQLRWEVRDKLDQANINERVLFPGLDGLCSWLRRHYSPVDTGKPSVAAENDPVAD
jgi:hypothetical protein